jgi:hypothetical protein
MQRGRAEQRGSVGGGGGESGGRDGEEDRERGAVVEVDVVVADVELEEAGELEMIEGGHRRRGGGGGGGGDASSVNMFIHEVAEHQLM